MKVSSLRLGLTLAAAGVLVPAVAMAQGVPPAAPPPATPPATPPAVPGPAPTPPPSTPPSETTPTGSPDTGPVTPIAPPAESPPAPPTEKPLPEAAAPPTAEAAPGEPPSPLPTVTGYVEAGYHVDLNHNSIYQPSVYRAYDARQGFMLHAAHLAVSHSFTPEASAFVSLDFGSDAALNSANYGAIPADVREGYVKWTPGDFTFQAGKFVTLNGIEIVDGPLNPTITRGFLYTLAEPVGHTGAKVNYGFGGGIAHLGVGLVNGWDQLLDNNNQKTVLFNGDIIPSADFHLQLSGSWGAEQNQDDTHHRLTMDLTGGAVLGALTLNVQALVGTESFGADGAAALDNGHARDTWFGIGIQPVFVADAFSLGGRLEYFNDAHGSRLVQGPAATPVEPDKASLLNFTITPGYMVARGLTLRAEFRIDAVLAAKDAAGNDAKNLFNGKSIQPTIGVGASYSF